MTAAGATGHEVLGVLALHVAAVHHLNVSDWVPDPGSTDLVDYYNHYSRWRSSRTCSASVHYASNPTAKPSLAVSGTYTVLNAARLA